MLSITLGLLKDLGPLEITLKKICPLSNLGSHGGPNYHTFLSKPISQIRRAFKKILWGFCREFTLMFSGYTFVPIGYTNGEENGFYKSIILSPPLGTLGDFFDGVLAGILLKRHQLTLF